MNEIKEELGKVIECLKKEAKESKWLSDDEGYNNGAENGLWIAIDKLEELERNLG